MARATSDLLAPRYGNPCESGSGSYCSSRSRLSMISTHCLHDSRIRRSLPDVLTVLKPHCPACRFLICLRSCFLREGYQQRCACPVIGASAVSLLWQVVAALGLLFSTNLTIAIQPSWNPYEN